jgi:hypothetical protein
MIRVILVGGSPIDSNFLIVRQNIRHQIADQPPLRQRVKRNLISPELGVAHVLASAQIVQCLRKTSSVMMGLNNLCGARTIAARVVESVGVMRLVVAVHGRSGDNRVSCHLLPPCGTLSAYFATPDTAKENQPSQNRISSNSRRYFSSRGM